MYKIGDKVTCEYYDDDEVFEITHIRKITNYGKNGEIKSEYFEYDIESSENFEDSIPEESLEPYKEKKLVFIDGKEYELKIGLIVKYCEELDQLINEDGLTIEAYCYDDNGKCDFCSEFDIVSHQSEDKSKNYWTECCHKPCDKDKPDYGEFTFYIKNE